MAATSVPVNNISGVLRGVVFFECSTVQPTVARHGVLPRTAEWLAGEEQGGVSLRERRGGGDVSRSRWRHVAVVRVRGRELELDAVRVNISAVGTRKNRLIRSSGQ